MAHKRHSQVSVTDSIGPRIIMAAIVLICTAGGAWLAVMLAAP